MTESGLKILKLRKAGMFSNVNEVIDSIIKAKKKGFKFVIDWRNSPYRDSSMRKENAWEYYFKQPFNLNLSYKNINEKMESVLGTSNEFVAPHDEVRVPIKVKDPTNDSHKVGLLLPPKNRKKANNVIKNHLHLKKKIKRKIDAFYKKYFSNPVIGVHLRGPYGTHGGSSYYRKIYETENSIPFKLVFKYVNSRLQEYEDASLFIASDSKLVINRFKSEYGNCVFSYDAIRTRTGEMHKSVEFSSIINRILSDLRNKDFSFRRSINRVKQTIDFSRKKSKYKLGEDVLVVSHLLSRVDHLIHGSSNLTNFVLCKNPELKSDFIFKPDLQNIYPALHEWELGGDVKRDIKRSSLNAETT